MLDGESEDKGFCYEALQKSGGGGGGLSDVVMYRLKQFHMIYLNAFVFLLPTYFINISVEKKCTLTYRKVV